MFATDQSHEETLSLSSCASDSVKYLQPHNWCIVLFTLSTGIHQSTPQACPPSGLGWFTLPTGSSPEGQPAAPLPPGPFLGPLPQGQGRCYSLLVGQIASGGPQSRISPFGGSVCSLGRVEWGLTGPLSSGLHSPGSSSHLRGAAALSGVRRLSSLPRHKASLHLGFRHLVLAF